MTVSTPRVVLRKDSPELPPITEASPYTAWRALGWFGLILAVVGLTDVALNWYPAAFSSAEWEFGTVALSLASLPLPSIGLAAVLASFLARGVRWGVITISVVLLLLGLAVLAAYGLFLMDVPMALKATASRPPAALAIKKGVAKTSVMGLTFGLGYLSASIAALRHSTRRVKHA